MLVLFRIHSNTAISMLGEKGFAMRIDFNPLKATKVQLPAGASWVVSNSLVESHKLLTGSFLVFHGSSIE
jgi:galactokinase